MLHLRERLARVGRAARPVPLTRRELFALPPLGGYRLTRRRRLNYYLNRAEYERGRTRLWSFPTRLIVEPASACNLRCPYCLTGAGDVGRPRALMTLELYRRLLDELGDYLFEMELFHWGEPLLNPHVYDMLEMASARGIATTVNTNLAVPFDRARAGAPRRERAERAHRLRRRRDARDVRAVPRPRAPRARRRELPAARRRAPSPRAGVDASQPRVPRVRAQRGRRRRDARAGGDARHAAPHLQGRCAGRGLGHRGALRLLRRAGAAPVHLALGHGARVDRRRRACLPRRLPVRRRHDDFTPYAGDFRAAWNHERFQVARGLFRRRTGTPDERRLPCDACPTTTFYESWRRHRDGGGTRKTFVPGVPLNANNAWNYFWARGQQAAPL